MSNFNENLFNVTEGRSLYCVWVSIRNHAEERLVAIWIDPAMTAFKSCARETLNGMDGAQTHFAGHPEEDVHLSAGEHVTSFLPPRS